MISNKMIDLGVWHSENLIHCYLGGTYDLTVYLQLPSSDTLLPLKPSCSCPGLIFPVQSYTKATLQLSNFGLPQSQ